MVNGMLTAGEGLLANGGSRGWYGNRALNYPPGAIPNRVQNPETEKALLNILNPHWSVFQTKIILSGYLYTHENKCTTISENV